jgi:hypothetical protein
MEPSAAERLPSPWKQRCASAHGHATIDAIFLKQMACRNGANKDQGDVVMITAIVLKRLSLSLFVAAVASAPVLFGA